MRIVPLVVGSTVLAVVVSAAAGATIHVDVANCPGPGSGSVGDPYCSVQTAIDNAVDTDEIVVAPGTYFETINFIGKAIWLHSLDGPEVTIIDAQQTGRVVTCNSGEGPDTVLEGLTISGGSGSNGGGMSNLYSSPTVTGCTFSGNSASNRGGGMYNNRQSHPTVTGCKFEGNTAARGGGMLNEDRVTVIDCLFIGNTATEGGGGIHDSSRPIVTNCTFLDNHARYGGGMVISIFGGSNLVIPVTDCTFIRNTADDVGGGLWLWVSQPNGVAVTNCIFNGNVASNKGGGMYNSSGGPVVTNCTFAGNTAAEGGGMNNAFSRPRITYCDFIANSATSLGGGMFNLWFLDRTVTDCLFDGNTADDSGGAVFNSGSDPTLINCTFSRNDAAGDGSAVTNETYDLGGTYQTLSLPTLINCVVWGNTANQIVSLDRLSATTVLFSDVEGGWSGDGSNNIDADPLFVDPDNGDYRIGPGSPCIDAANTNAVPGGIVTDLDGNARFIDDPNTTNTGLGSCPVDMGAYEFQQGPSCTPCPWDCGGDDDGTVGIVDFLTLLAQWGGPGSCDFDGGGVGINDFLTLLESWGPCP